MNGSGFLRLDHLPLKPIRTIDQLADPEMWSRPDFVLKRPIGARKSGPKVRVCRQNCLSMKTILESRPEAADDWATRIATVTANADVRDNGLIAGSIGSLLRVVREQLHLEVVFVGEFVDGHRVFRHISSKADDAVIKPGQFHPLDETICQRIVDGRMPSIVHDVARARSDYGLP